jgi:hypothetical protein
MAASRILAGPSATPMLVIRVGTMLVKFFSMTFALIYFVGQLTFQSEESFPDRKG